MNIWLLKRGFYISGTMYKYDCTYCTLVVELNVTINDHAIMIVKQYQCIPVSRKVTKRKINKLIEVLND